MSDLESAKQILKKYNQEHLISFYDELNKEEKEKLVNQICDLDFEQILKLYDDSMTDEEIDEKDITALDYVIKRKLSDNQLKELKEIGEDVIRSGKYAVVTLAGGQGSRLGYRGPKGTYELEFEPHKRSLFELMCEQLHKAYEKYGVFINWYIMTSTENYSQTKNYFRMKNFFNYPEENIKFFTQSNLPLIDINKKLMLEEMYKIRVGANGNGDVFNSMLKHNILNDIEKKEIDWVMFTGIDNVILDIVDPILLGLTIKQEFEVASKSIFKSDASNKEWIFVKHKGKPRIISPDYLSDKMKNEQFSDGRYKYREINILAHLFSREALKKLSDVKLEYHRAFKKNTFINEEGMKQVPESPNSYKFENFIFDAFKYFNDMTILEVEKSDEFAPIKDFTGPFNPEVAKNLYEAKQIKLKYEE